MIRPALAVFTLAAATCVGVAIADDEAPATQPAMSAEDAAMMQAYLDAATPGEAHAQLEAMVGDWDVESTFIMPDGSEMTSTASASSRMMLGGRFLHQTYRGDMMGTPFIGEMFIGHNNLTGEYESVWMDEMSSGMAISRGSFDGQTLTLAGEYAQPGSGEVRPFETRTTIESDDVHVMRFYEPGPDGEMTNTMSLRYTRAADQ